MLEVVDRGGNLISAVWHHVERHANNPIKADRSQLSTGSD
jgi:hypothetical protein